MTGGCYVAESDGAAVEYPGYPGWPLMAEGAQVDGVGPPTAGGGNTCEACGA